MLVLLVQAARHDAPTFDEPTHIAWALSLRDHGHFYDGPSLSVLPGLARRVALSTTPLVPTPEQPPGARDFFIMAGVLLIYTSPTPPGTVLLLARAPTIGMALLVALVAWWAARRRHGPGAGLLAVVLVALEPPLLAHGHLATNDVWITALALLAWEGAAWEREGGGWPARALAAVALGAALATKATALFLGPLLLVDALLARPRPGRPAPSLVARLRSLAIIAAAALPCAVVAAGFHVGMLAHIYLDAASLPAGRWQGGYFLGELRDTPHRLYYLAALGVKSSLPLLALVLVRLGLDARGSRRAGLSELAAPAVWVLLASLGPFTIGVRHVLPVLPLLAIYAAGAPWRVEGARGRRLVIALAAGLVLWHGADVVRSSPRFIAWFNVLAGRRGSVWLADSNLDWGQDMTDVAPTMRQLGVRGVYLAPFWNGDPAAHGVAHQRVAGLGVTPEGDHVFAPSEPRVLIVSINLVLGLGGRPTLYTWLRERAPITTIGGTLLVYDLTRDPAGLVHLARCFVVHRRPDRARETLLRARQLGAAVPPDLAPLLESR